LGEQRRDTGHPLLHGAAMRVPCRRDRCPWAVEHRKTVVASWRSDHHSFCLRRCTRSPMSPSRPLAR